MPAATLLAHAALLAQLSAPYPFAVGETLQYEASLGYFPIGTATATVARTTRERGADAFVFAMTGEGGPPGIRVRYELTSRGATLGVRLTDDARRLPVQLDLPLPYGTVTLQLTGTSAP